jgi:hypothetical protein
MAVRWRCSVALVRLHEAGISLHIGAQTAVTRRFSLPVVVPRDSLVRRPMHEATLT